MINKPAKRFRQVSGRNPRRKICRQAAVWQLLFIYLMLFLYLSSGNPMHPACLGYFGKIIIHQC
jgi:hypothetical protein